MWQGVRKAVGKTARRLPVGAEILPDGGAHFRVWADRAERVSVVFFAGLDEIARAECGLQPEGDGYLSGFVAEAKAGDLYLFRLNGGEMFADPASRFQPDGRQFLRLFPTAYLSDKYGREPFVAATFVLFTLFPLSMLYSHNFAMLVFAFIIRAIPHLPSRCFMASGAFLPIFLYCGSCECCTGSSHSI